MKFCCLHNDSLGMVGILCRMVDGLVKQLLYLFWDVGLLRYADGLGMSLDCEVRDVTGGILAVLYLLICC